MSGLHDVDWFRQCIIFLAGCFGGIILRAKNGVNSRREVLINAFIGGAMAQIFAHPITHKLIANVPFFADIGEYDLLPGVSMLIGCTGFSITGMAHDWILKKLKARIEEDMPAAQKKDGGVPEKTKE